MSQSIFAVSRTDVSKKFGLEEFGERFEPRSHFKSRLSLVVPVNEVLNRTVVDSD